MSSPWRIAVRAAVGDRFLAWRRPAWVLGLLLAGFACRPGLLAAVSDDDQDETPAQLPQGLVAVYQDSQGLGPFERMEPVPRLFGRPGDMPHPRLPGGPFRVTWKGRLAVPYDGQYTFWIEQAGGSSCRLLLGGKPAAWGQPLGLRYGNVGLEISADAGPGASLAVYWANQRFAREPIAPRFFRHSPNDTALPDLARQQTEDCGATLAEALGCFQCHDNASVWQKSLGAGLAMEARLPGPRLGGVGQRVSRPWLSRYLRDPAALRPGTRMPAIAVRGSEDETALRTIVVYLSASGDVAAAAPVGLPPGESKHGARLFIEHACAACHEPPAASRPAAVDVAPVPKLQRLAEKWRPAALAAFLEDPLAQRPHGRMPDPGLSRDEARDVAAFLLTRSEAGEPSPPAAPVAIARPAAAAPDAALTRVPGCLLWLRPDMAAGKLIDDSGRGHQGRLVGDEDLHPLDAGQALHLEGPKEQVIVEPSGDLGTSGDFTWSAWIRTAGSGVIFARAPAGGKWVHGGKTLFVRNGKLCFDVGWVGAVTSRAAVADDRWHHVAVTVARRPPPARPEVKLYIDGQNDATQAGLDVFRFAEKGFVLKLGRASVNFPQPESFKGLIRAPAMWRRALSAGEITELVIDFSYLAAAEAGEFAGDDLKRQWAALGGDAEGWERLRPGSRLAAVALRQMAAKGCLNCHDAGPQSFVAIERRESGPSQIAGGPRAPLLGRQSQADRGCLAAEPAGAAPRFAISAEQRAALSAYVAALAARTSPSLSESLRVEMATLNCVACHENEGSGGEPLVALLGGRDKAQFVLPHPLWGVATRLRPQRLAEFLCQGDRQHRMRPWLAARMPGFGGRGGRLAEELLGRDHLAVAVDTPAAPEDEAAAASSHVALGQLLVSNKGLACVNCHAVNGAAPSGEIDPSTRAPDLGMVARHLRRDYVQRLLCDPDRVFPGTKMPATFPRSAAMPLPATLADLPRQALFESLWDYLSLGPKARKPAEEELAVALPNALRPAVQRGPTSVDKRLVGRGIACGFPAGTLLFDADRLEPAALWFEGFLFRVPTNYFGLAWRAPRGAAILDRHEQGLVYQAPGDGRWREPLLPLDSDANDGSRFDGYTVGPHEVTFRYRLRYQDLRVAVTEVVEVERRPPWRGLRRMLAVEGLPAGARVAWTLPRAVQHQWRTADGRPDGRADDAGRTPLVSYEADGRPEVVAAETRGATWQQDSGLGEVRIASARATARAAVVLCIERWLFYEKDAPAVEKATRLLVQPAASHYGVLLAPPEPTPPKDPLPEKRLPAKPTRPALAAAGKAAAPAASQPRPEPAALRPESPFTYKLEPLNKPNPDWRPSGVAFTADGQMYACDLTEGTVHRAPLPPAGKTSELPWTLYASGLNIPTGMAAIGNRLFVAHRPEVTELIDSQGSGVADTFRTLMGPWSLKDGFHEYAFGLAVDPQRRLYVALNNGYFWSYGGPTNRGRYRSYVLRCGLDGRSQEVGWGCRVPNGICAGPDGEVFFIDNQGDWIQECKLVQCRPGTFYGHPETPSQFLPEGQVPAGLPAVWIPYDVIRSAAALCFDTTGGRFGPFAGQFFTGDVGYGQSTNIMRMALEKVGGVYQGAAMHFIDRQPAGPQFAAFGPDGQMYVCCLTDGLVRIRFGGQTPMEIHHVGLRRDNRGFAIHFTRPLDPGTAAAGAGIRVRRWYLPYGIAYGSPRLGETSVPVEKVTLAADRMSLDVQVPIVTYKNCMVYYIHVGNLKSADGRAVEHPEAYYTVQRTWP